MNDDREMQESPDDPQLSALYRRTRIETPSSALDDSIRDAARRVAQRRRYRWLLPVSSAAVVLLGLSLTLQVVELDHPPEEATLSELEEAEAKKESASMPDRAGSDMPAPAPPPAASREMPVGDTEDTDHMRKRLTAPMKIHDRRERPALILDQAATPGATVPSRARADGQEAGGLEFESPVGLGSDPTLWLRHIRDLVTQGRIDEATTQLAEFRTGYPNYPLPDDLAGLLNP